MRLTTTGLGFTAVKSNRRLKEKELAETQELLPTFIRQICARHCEQKRWDKETAKSKGGLLSGFRGRKEILHQEHTPKLSVEAGSRGKGGLSKETGCAQHETLSPARFGVTHAQGVGRPWGDGVAAETEAKLGIWS